MEFSVNHCRATPSAAGPNSWEEGCVVVAICCAGSFTLLGLLFVGCFACFGFPVKCAEASWLLEISFVGFRRLVLMAFSIIAVTTLILLFWLSTTYHLAGLVPPLY